MLRSIFRRPPKTADIGAGKFIALEKGQQSSKPLVGNQSNADKC